MLSFLLVMFVIAAVALNGYGTFSLHVRVCLRFHASPLFPALLRCSGLFSVVFVVVVGFVVLFVVVALVCF